MKNDKNANIEDMDDFFLESEKKKARNRRTDKGDNMDYSFVEKERNGGGIIAFIIILLLLIGGASYYYFIIDSPQKIFATMAKVILKEKEPEKISQIELDFELTPNILTENEDYKIYTNIINEVTINGTIGTDLDNKLSSASLLTTYKEKDLLDISYLAELTEDGNLYLKSDRIFDKIIKIEASSEITKEDTNQQQEYDINLDDYQTLINSFISAIKSAMMEAKYEKEYVKIDETYLKKITLNIDRLFVEKVYGELLDDESFIKSYAKIYDMTESEVIDELNQEMYDLEDFQETLSIYLTIIKNEFIKLEYLANGDDLIITKENNTYTYELSESYTTIYEGYIKINEDVNNLKSITLNLGLLEEKTSFTIDLNYLYKENQTISKIDTSKSVSIDDLTEEDFNKMLDNISKNETILTLLEDLGLKDNKTNIEV